MQTKDDYRAFILRLRDEQHRPLAELWPAAKRYLGEAEAAALLGPEPPGREPRPVPARRQPRPAPPPAPKEGPGTELKAMLVSIGLTDVKKCNCEANMATMNRWGVQKCREQRDWIIAQLRAGKTAVSWTQRLKAYAAAVTTGLAFHLDPLDPFGSLVDEAIRRAEEKEAARQPPPAGPPS